MPLNQYWTLDAQSILRELSSSTAGLTPEEAASRLRGFGRNELRESVTLSRTQILWGQLRSPLLLLLLFAAAASAFTGEWVDASIVAVIVAASVAIGCAREFDAQTAAAALRARIRVHATAVRAGQSVAVGLEEVVPGDVILLSAGSIVPADAVVIEADSCFVSEAVVTGESFPVEKQPGPLPHGTPLTARTNCVFLGTNVRSGTARCVVVKTAQSTQFGSIAQRLELRPPETDFDRGIRRFGYLLTIAMLVMVLVVFAVHMLAGRPPGETLLFAIALAVGLSPELLPAILSVNLARGAQAMANHGVLVRHLNAIENLGSMDVLCTDKTGTLTEGIVQVEGAYDCAGHKSKAVLELATLNATLQSGLANPLDVAILQLRTPDLTNCRKLGEIPFDFVRKRLSIIVEEPAGVRLITKGAFHHVIQVCSHAADGTAIDAARTVQLERRFEEWSSRGVRVIAVAARSADPQATYSREDERELTFMGFVTFLDHPKAGAAEALTDLARLGVSVKLITGDHKLVAQHIARLMGMRADRALTGEDLDNLHDEALWREAERTELFVEVDPNQKERIILSLKKMGYVVGFLGDGVNDAPAMHAADTSLSVEGAVDVARQAADFVLLDKHLDVIRMGILEGRRTFANTLKYVLTTTSANLGNMVSMAAASLFLPFLPLLASQILLNNFLSDIPAMGLANDNIDEEVLERPGRWNMRFIGRFMMGFGLLSSIFDLLTFAALLIVFRAGPDLFRTAWFVESLLTELVIALVVRTRRPLFNSRPGELLLWLTVALIGLTVLVPFLPFAHLLGFVPLSGTLLATLCGITGLYTVAAEIAKRPLFQLARLGVVS